MRQNWSPQNPNQSPNMAPHLYHARAAFTPPNQPRYYNRSPGSMNMSPYSQGQPPMRSPYFQGQMPMRAFRNPYDVGSSPRVPVGRRGRHSLGTPAHSTPHDRRSGQYEGAHASFMTDSFGSTQDSWECSGEQFSTPSYPYFNKRGGHFSNSNFSGSPSANNRNRQRNSMPSPTQYSGPTGSSNNLPNCLKDPWYHLSPTPAPPGQKSLISRAGQRHSFLTPQKAAEAISSKLDDINENFDLFNDDNKPTQSDHVDRNALKPEYEPSHASLDRIAPKLRPTIQLPAPKCSASNDSDGETSPEYKPTPIPLDNTEEQVTDRKSSIPILTDSVIDDDSEPSPQYIPAPIPQEIDNNGFNNEQCLNNEKDSSIECEKSNSPQEYCPQVPNESEIMEYKPDCAELSPQTNEYIPYNPISPDVDNVQCPSKKCRLILPPPRNTEENKLIDTNNPNSNC